jgi:hypothetical protein
MQFDAFDRVFGLRPDCQVYVIGTIVDYDAFADTILQAVTRTLSLMTILSIVPLTTRGFGAMLTNNLTCLSFVSLVSLAWPLWRFWRAMCGTAMRYTCIWAVAAVALWAVVTGLAMIEPDPGSWNSVGYLRLLSTGFLTAPIVSVLGARRPGEKAWNLIVVSLLVVFALPILEQWLLSRPIESGRVGMDGPRAAFFLLVVGVGAINYCLTRFAIATVFFSLSPILQMCAIGPWNTGDLPARSVYFAVAGIVASASVWMAYLSSPRNEPHELATQWQRLRNGWGLLWSARVRERWNASVRRYGWPIRLNWFGPAITCDGATSPEQMAAAEREFNILARRFFELPPDEPWSEPAVAGQDPRM